MNKENEKLPNLPIAPKEGKGSAKTNNTGKHKKANKLKSENSRWKEIFHNEYIQFGLFIVNILMVGAFIIFGSIQRSQTKKTDYENGILAIKDTLARDRNVKRELRAYLSIKQFMNVDFKPNTLMNYDIEIINTGKTPAYNITFIARVIILKNEPTPQHLKEIDNSSKSDGKTSCIGSNQTLSLTIRNGAGYNFPISQGEYNSVDKGMSQANLLGSIIYDDIFGEKHFTHFNVKYIPSSRFIFYNEKYNDAN